MNKLVGRERSETKCLQALRAHGVEQVAGAKEIEAEHETPIGIRLWGYIDYLCNHCKYRFFRVQTLASKRRR